MQIHDAERSCHAVAAQRACYEHVQDVLRRVRWGRKGAGSGSKEPDGGSGPAPARHGHPQDGIDGACATSIWRARGAQDDLPPAGRKGSMPAAARVLALAPVPGHQRPERRPDARLPATLADRRLVVGCVCGRVLARSRVHDGVLEGDGDVQQGLERLLDGRGVALANALLDKGAGHQERGHGSLHVDE
jgi:hypothetical protein